MAGYNRTRYVEQLLEKTEFLPPSFTVHLHSEYWVLNNGSKLLYNHPTACLLDDIRTHRIPIDFLELFDSARVPFYEGCMVVELLDYRPQRSSEPALKNPDKTRVVLHPSPETLWADICSLNQRNGGQWTDMDALQIEAKVLLATTQPLCLDPDPHLTRIVNNVLRASTPSMPLSLKRKSSALDPEEDGPERAKRERLLGFMAPRDNRLHAPSYRLLDAIEINKQKKEANKASAANQHGDQYISANAQSVQPVPPQTQPTPTPQSILSAPVAAPSPQDRGEAPAQIDTPQTFDVPFRPTPVPQSHQFVGQHPPASTIQPNTIQPQVYANLQDAAMKRAPTPAQQQQIHYPHYMQQYLYSPQLQQQPHQTAAQSQPPSHLQIQPATQPNQTLPSPQPPTQQLNPQVGQPQRYTQTPKPTQVLPTTVQPTQTLQQQPTVSVSPYQGAVPNPHFPQPAAVRPIQRTPQGQPGASQHPQLTLPANANPSQPLYNPLQQGQPSLQHQLYLSRMSQATPVTGGRTTPAQTQQSPGIQAQSAQLNRAITATPSPAKGSPVIHQQTIATAIQPRASPMQAKAQISMQPSGGGQAIAILGQQSQPTQAQQAGTQLNPGGMQMQPQRYQYQQYGHSQLRPLVHGNPQITGTPTMAHASPATGGRPLTPAEPQLSGATQAQQQPIRRPTPLQQQQPAVAQLPAHLVKQQTPQLQPQQLPQSQQAQAQGQQIQAASPQVQQAELAVHQHRLQQQQMSAFASRFGFPPYWQQAQQQQHQGQPATTVQMASMSQQQWFFNQIQSQGGQRVTPQMQAYYKTQQSVGGQQMQGGQSVHQQQSTQQVQSQQHQLSNAQAQATMMGKMQMQVGPQTHLQQGHIQGIAGGQGQATSMSPAQMHMPHFQQSQAHSPIAQAQHGVQQKAKPTTGRKGPVGR